MYHYIFFDLDGTLTDSKEGIFKSVRYALEKLGRPVPGDDILTLFVGPPLADSFMNFCGMTRPEADEAVRIFRERYAVKGLFENAAVPGGPELLRRLKERGYVLAWPPPSRWSTAGPLWSGLATPRTWMWWPAARVNPTRPRRTSSARPWPSWASRRRIRPGC